MIFDPVALTQELIRCPSVTPFEGGALKLLENWLTQLGFTCTRLDFEDVPNLYARLGSASPHFCFAGHTDVVPPGEEKAWTHPPFSGVLADGKVWGRGAVDMKGGIACFVSAVADYLKMNPSFGSISLLITGDEEGPAIHGTQKMLRWLEASKEIPDFCLIGEPTCSEKIGDTIKIGRRGSITAQLTCYGRQGHIAYPYLADNPIPRMLTCLQTLLSQPLDQGSEHFEPSRLEITSIDADNLVTNIIPAKISARFGIRINDQAKASYVSDWVTNICQTHGHEHKLDLTTHGEAFLTKDSQIIQLIHTAVEKVTKTSPSNSTTGGTSDGRFISHYCPVIECGLNEDTMHQVDEHVPVQDLMLLKDIYLSILNQFFT